MVLIGSLVSFYSLVYSVSILAKTYHSGSPDLMSRLQDIYDKT